MSSGGAERVAATLCSALVARGDYVALIPTFSGGGVPFYPLHERVELIYLAERAGPVQGGNKRYWKRIGSLRQIIADKQPDVVVSFLPNVNIAAIVATAFSKIPCIVCERSDPRMQAVSWVWRLACKLLYRTADRLTVQTRAVAESIGQVYGGLKDVAVVPNPLPQGVLAWQARQVSRERRTLLSLGRLSEEKRVNRIIDAFSQLAPGFPDWDLHVYGDGPLKHELAAQIATLGLQERVRLMGRTDEPWRVMASSDAFVMASRYEGFPNALLEAMGIGLPCVTTDCPSGPREISRDGVDALLVPNDDDAGLRDALAQLMGNETLRKDLGQRARASVVARYSLDAVLRTWDEIFASVGVRP